MAMHGYAWLCVAMRAYVWTRKDMHGYAIRMDMHGYAWICVDTHGYVWKCERRAGTLGVRVSGVRAGFRDAACRDCCRC